MLVQVHRRASLAAVVLALAGCGGGDPAPPRDTTATLELGWVERDGPIEIEARRLVVAPTHWYADIGVVNRGRVTYYVERPHVPGGVRFGLLATAGRALPRTERIPPYIVASEIEPDPPHRLRPGESWHGRIGGLQRLPPSVYVHVVVGRFRNGNDRFMAVTHASTRLP